MLLCYCTTLLCALEAKLILNLRAGQGKDRAGQGRAGQGRSASTGLYSHISSNSTNSTTAWTATIDISAAARAASSNSSRGRHAY